jgi:hypothetical protein
MNYNLSSMKKACDISETFNQGSGPGFFIFEKTL